MKTNRISTTQIASFICAALSLLIVILQFTPFWQFDGGSVSIASYISFPTDHKEVTDYLTATLGDGYSINQIVVMHVLQLVLGVAGAVLCLMKSSSPLVVLVPAVTGAVGIWGFLSKPAYRLGGNWVFQLIIGIVLTVFAIVSLVYHLKKKQ